MSTDAPLIPDLTALPDDPALLKQLVVQLFATLQERDRRVAQLEQQMHLLVKRFLRPGSEKLDPRQLTLFDTVPDPNAAIAEPPPPPPAPPGPVASRTTGHGRRRAPETLERQEVIHDLTPEQKLALGGEEALVLIGEEVTEQYEWKPSCLFVLEHHQKKYVRRERAANPDGESNSAVPTDHEGSSSIVVAAKPPQPIPGGEAGPGLLAQVFVSKYGDHLPLHRLERIFERHGVRFARQTTCDWCAAGADRMRPLTNAFRDEILASFVIHTDDTPVDVRDAHAKQQLQGRFWTYVGDQEHPLIWFDFTPGRQRAGPDQVLTNYRGYLQADGYGGYDGYEGVRVEDASPILKVACWAHARRKFHDALRTDSALAQIALARIGQLYAIEKELKQHAEPQGTSRSAAERGEQLGQQRRTRAGPILTNFRAWLDEQSLRVIPKSPIAKAIYYTLHQWDALVRYLADGRLAIDNNAAERTLRGIAIGRKNWLFCGSERGGHTAAVHFSLIASAVRNGHDPYAYLRDVLTRLPLLGESPARDALRLLLPHLWQPS